MTPVEIFPALEALPDITHGFVIRIPDLSVQVARAEAMERLRDIHRQTLSDADLGDRNFVTAEQVHAAAVSVVNATTTPQCIAGADALITNDPAVCLGIYVADCAAVYFVDPVRHAIGLAHSGKKGTELAISTRTIELMARTYGSCPEDLIVQISPCIRPPNYENDFAAIIRYQADQAGVKQVHDCGICTGADTARYYSYRMEKGCTGRMLAYLALT